MKKALIFFCTLILALSLTACNNNSNNDDMNNDASGGSSLGSSIDSAIDNATSDVTELIAKITGEEAKKAALDHAGLKEDEVTDLDVDLDRDNGALKYEVDFHHGGIEYDYDIDAKTGKIISADKDREN